MAYAAFQKAEAERQAAAASEAGLRDLARHKVATAKVLETLEAEQDRRRKPHEDRKAEIRAAIDLLEKLEGECDIAIIAIETEMRSDIEAAEAEANAADAEHWQAYLAERRARA